MLGTALKQKGDLAGAEVGVAHRHPPEPRQSRPVQYPRPGAAPEGRWTPAARDVFAEGARVKQRKEAELGKMLQGSVQAPVPLRQVTVIPMRLRRRSPDAVPARLRPLAVRHASRLLLRPDSLPRCRSASSSSTWRARPACAPRPSSASERKNKFLLETTGCGCAFFDYDNDGWLDIFLVNGTRFEAKWPAGPGARQPALQEQSRRHIHRCHRESRRGAHRLGPGRLRRRL